MRRTLRPKRGEELPREPFRDALRRSVLDRQWEDITPGKYITFIAKGNFPLLADFCDVEMLALPLEEEMVVKGVADFPRGALHSTEVPDPAVFGEFTFQFDKDVVVLAVERFALPGEGGHVRGGETEPVACDGDFSGGRHLRMVADAGR